jgi:hypothetical protein
MGEYTIEITLGIFILIIGLIGYKIDGNKENLRDFYLIFIFLMIILTIIGWIYYG